VFPILGRGKELQAIAGALAAGGTRVVALTGEAGSGKTRLLAEAARLAVGRPLLQLRGFQPEQAVPLVAAGPLLSALAGVDSRLQDVLTQDAPGAMVHLFELAHRALRKSGDDTVILVDDEHWLDPTTRALVHYLVRSSAAELGDLCLVSASRPSVASTGMQESFRSMARHVNLTTLTVAPLDRGSGIELVRHLDPGLSADAAVQHWQRAGGSPFWLTLLASGDHSSTDGLIEARVQACAASARAVLEVLAVAARPVEVTHLAGLAGVPPAEAEVAVVELSDRGLVTSRSGSVGVVHDLVRDALVAQIPPEVVRRRHREVAAWLSRSDDPAVLLAALQHRVAAGEPFGDLALRVATSPRRAWLGGDGAAELVRLSVGRSVGPEPELLVALASLAQEVGEVGLALQMWSRAANGRGSEAVRHRACVGAGRAAYECTDLEAARTWLERARAFPGADLQQAVAVEVLEADVLRWLESRFDEADECSRRAMRLVEQDRTAGPAGERVRRATVDALGSLAHAAMVRGDVEAMDEYAARLEEWSAGDPELSYTAMLYRLTSLNLQGEPARALDLLRPHWEAALESGSPSKQLALGGHLVSLLTKTARLCEAEEATGRLRQLLARVTDPNRRLPLGLSAWYTQAAVLEFQLLTGDWRNALERITAVLDSLVPHNRLSLAADTAEMWSRLSSPLDPRVGALAARALALAEEVGCPRCGEEARLVVARTRARAGDGAGACALLDRWDRPDAPRDVHRRVAWTRALVLALDNDPEAAAGLADQVDRELRSSGAELDRMWLLLDRTRILRDVDRAAAVAACEQLASRAHAAGAPNLVAVAQRELRALGARPWRRGVTSRENLSDRERQVADLVATGLTNPEIADRLFLSRKTVERHVSNALGKLGARNRTELAAVWRVRGAAPQGEGVPR